MSTTTYETTRRTTVKRTSPSAKRAPTRRKTVAKSSTTAAVFEIIEDADVVLVDGLMPARLAKLFASMTVAYNAGQLKID